MESIILTINSVLGFKETENKSSYALSIWSNAIIDFFGEKVTILVRDKQNFVLQFYNGYSVRLFLYNTIGFN